MFSPLLRQARSGIVSDSSPLAQGLFPWPTGERSRVMTYCLPTSKFMVYKQPTKRPPALSSSSRPSPGRMRDSLLSIKLFYLTPSTCSAWFFNSERRDQDLLKMPFAHNICGKPGKREGGTPIFYFCKSFLF
jgi:hypothetical protein